MDRGQALEDNSGTRLSLLSARCWMSGHGLVALPGAVRRVLSWGGVDERIDILSHTRGILAMSTMRALLRI